MFFDQTIKFANIQQIKIKTNKQKLQRLVYLLQPQGEQKGAIL